MRILFLCNSTKWGGAERYVQAVANALEERGHAVFAAVPPGSPLHASLEACPAITVMPLDLGPKLARRSAIELATRWPAYTRVLRRSLHEWRHGLGIDVLHVQFKKEQLLATRAARRLGMRVIWTEHGPLPPPLVRAWPAFRLYRRSAAQASAVVCVSEAVAHDLAGHGLSGRTLHVCPNGITIPESPPPGTGDAVRASLGLPRDAVVVAAIGRLSWVKGLGHLIDAVPLILERDPSVHFLIVGEGPERDRLEALASTHGVTNQVLFTGHRDDVGRVLAAVDVLAMSSLSEGLPFAAMEAMAAGVPVVASRVGALPELLDEGRAGVLVGPGAVEELASKLAEIATSPDERGRLGRRGRERIAEKFNSETMIDCTETIMASSS